MREAGMHNRSAVARLSDHTVRTASKSLLEMQTFPQGKGEHDTY